MAKPYRSVSPLHPDTLSILSRYFNSTQYFLTFSVTLHMSHHHPLCPSSLCLSLTFISQVSLPYSIELLTHALHILPFNLRYAPLAVSIGDKSLNFLQAHTLPSLRTLLSSTFTTRHSKIPQYTQLIHRFPTIDSSSFPLQL